MDIQIRLLTWFHGRLMGIDSVGNRYYQHKSPKLTARRWVIYRGAAEASRIPPLWHAWLHHTLADPPTQTHAHPWEKPHQPNLTGTSRAHRPDAHPVHPPYEPWLP